jgi:hypothetical protein
MLNAVPPTNVNMVYEFVSVAHSNLNRVQELIVQEPNLINAAWDWGGGDWETALGAAAHMGRADIAIYLLEHGARLDIFAATMLGKLEIVKAAVAIYPEIIHVAGPHGISLIDHANAGGEASSAVKAFLEDKLNNTVNS